MAKPSSDTITLNGDTPLTIGSQVTFTVETDEQFPWIECQCFNPEGNLVYSQINAGFNHGQATFPEVFQLGPTGLWQSGPADGHATAFLSTKNNHRKILAETSFQVE